MDIEKFRLFIEALKFGSLKKTAEALQYTQSGLLYQINGLEKELGVPLLLRDHRGVTATEIGQELLPHLERILEEYQQLNDHINAISNKQKNSLRIGVYPSVASNWLPRILPRFIEKYGDADVSIYVGAYDIPHWLDSDLIDFAVAERSAASKFEWDFLHKNEIYACIPRDHPLANNKAVTLDELKEYTLLNFSHYGSTSKMIIDRIPEKNNVRKIYISNNDGSAIMSLIGQGMGITFLSSLYLDECTDNVRMIPLEPPIFQDMGIIKAPSRRQSSVALEFIRELKSIL